MIDFAAVAGTDVSTLLARSLGAIELMAIGLVALLLLRVLYLLALAVYAAGRGGSATSADGLAAGTRAPDR